MRLVRIALSGFDAALALAGFGALLLLGPGMLLTALDSAIPDVDRLTAVEGTVAACREGWRGSTFALAGRPERYYAAAGSCADLVADAGQATPVQFMRAPRADALLGDPLIRSFGLTVDARAIRRVSDDVKAARIDRGIRVAVGIAATLGLVLALIYVPKRARSRRSDEAASAARTAGESPIP